MTTKTLYEEIVKDFPEFAKSINISQYYHNKDDIQLYSILSELLRYTDSLITTPVSQENEIIKIIEYVKSKVLNGSPYEYELFVVGFLEILYTAKNKDKIIALFGPEITTVLRSLDIGWDE